MTFLVVLAEQADLSGARLRQPQHLDHAAELTAKEVRGRAVYDALREIAQCTQAPLRAELDALGVKYRPYYIVNMLAVRGDARLALALAARPDVARLEANPAIRVSLPPTEQKQPLASAQPTAAEWGLLKINADDVWALGYSGQGIVVAGQDTGYEWDHPALKEHYRGWDDTTVVHDYHWHDAIHSNTHGANPCGADSPFPCDDNSHGTHTMGTFVGDDGGSNQIGVAPGARWIGCRNMDNGWGTPATYAECFEFFLAPYPIGGDPMTDGDPDLAPHVINNSWTCPPAEGCDVTSLQTVVENVRAAGIVVVVSAGNSGSACETVNTPPAIHDAAFSVGATYSSDQIAGFSSRGPVTVDGSNRPKPDVSAPGVSVRSSVPGGGYAFKSGTSMAAPHTAGVVALLWSAASHLIGDVDLTEEIIRETARPFIDTTCGGDADGHPNNVYGWGIVDAMAAVQEAMGADLRLSKTAAPATPVPPGGTVTYRLAFSNTGAAAMPGAVITDVVPVSVTVSSVISSGVVITDVSTPPTYVWQVASLAPGQGGIITLTGSLTDVLPAGSLVNEATIAGALAEGMVDNNMGQASITVAQVPPIAVDGAASGDEESMLNGSLSASDANADPLTYSLVTSPTLGSLSLDDVSTGDYSYTPVNRTADYTVTFTFKANDGVADSNVVTTTLTVAADNDPLVALGSSASITVGRIASGTIAVSDPDTDDFIQSFVINAGPVFGTASVGLTSGTWVYTPTTAAAADYNDVFSVAATDSGGNTALASVNIQVDVDGIPSFDVFLPTVLKQATGVRLSRRR